MDDQHDVVVIGGGQAGLAAAYHLSRAGVDHVVLDAGASPGDQWRRRWDSLRLFTPVQHSTMPGLPWEKPRGYFPTKDEVADYLARYREVHGIAVRHGARVTRLSRDAGGFALETSTGALAARSVVVATGATSLPHVPDVGAGLDPSITQLHSDSYRSPADVPGRRVLVVGFGTSGAELAVDLARAGRQVTIAGRPTPHPPDALLAVAGGAWWVMITKVLNRRTPLGRRVAPRALAHGAPLIRISARDVADAGVRRAGRIDGVDRGLPVADGAPLDVDAVLWCTGYRGNLSWIDIPALERDAHGFPVAPFGLVPEVPGLGFVGMPFQTRLASPLLGGVGEDAASVVAALAPARALVPGAG
ncbi:flavin-containing monooxygenase [Demequina maris]|uniref:flavin-containing monooxygenase n=1 Tax=Demequina maris TaxID=1638982 RepID=UPI000781019A|nr:NAD(P)/FAD-dependent oxidoreductase [Demequina maris]